MSQPNRVAGQAFISYAREDKAQVDLLQQALERAGVPVWRDTRDIWPGHDWRLAIRRAISDDALVFIACFSRAGMNKERSYQNEELALAIDQLRKRPAGLPWLIPVRFDDCVLPDSDLGGGRTLESIQWANLFGETLAEDTKKLIGSVRQILGTSDQRKHSGTFSRARSTDQVLIPSLPTATPLALSQLPPKMLGFVGRDEDLRLMSELLDPAEMALPVVVSAIAGLAGIGKTSLAIQAAHAARERGWFGGGVLFVDLHGYDEVPVESTQALDSLLRGLGVADQHIPATAEERTARYRSKLSDITEPVLVIADNASSEEQVIPLLPGEGPHRVIITSRHTLAGLEARLLDLTVLARDAGMALLDVALRTARSDDRRINHDVDSARTLVEICGRLPLALRIAAAILKADPDLTLAELCQELSTETQRLKRLRYPSGTGSVSVEAAFETSYRRLDEGSGEAFRLLSVNPGPDISSDAVAILTGLPVDETLSVLAKLSQAHLVEAVSGPAGRRWRMHDLLRLYAHRLSVENASADGRESALNRLLSYYVDIADAADDRLHPMPPGKAASTQFTNLDEALAWLDAERPGLVTAVVLAAGADRPEVALLLSLQLTEYLALRRRFDDVLTVTEIGARSASRIGDRHREGMALRNLGIALHQMDRVADAVSAHRAAIAIYRETGDRHGEGGALYNLSSALSGLGEYQEAMAVNEETAAIFKQTGDRNGEGKTRLNASYILWNLCRYDEALTAARDAAMIFAETSDSLDYAFALDWLAALHLERDAYDDAVVAYQDAVGAFRAARDRYGEGRALYGEGAAQFNRGRHEDAASAYQAAVEVFQETGDDSDEGRALNDLATVLQHLRRFVQATAALEKALTIFSKIGDSAMAEQVTRNLQDLRTAGPG